MSKCLNSQGTGTMCMVEKEQMQQTCMTELSELCEKLAKDFDLPRHSENGKIVLQGDTYNITHGIYQDKQEKVCYHDNMVTVAFSEDNHVCYIVKGKYISGQKSVLWKTRLGRRISRELDVIEARHKFTDNQKNQITIKAEAMYLNEKEVYDLINSFIFA